MKLKSEQLGKQDRLVTQLAELSFEYIVIGAGPNGILLAKNLVENGKQVLLIESGGLDSEEGLITRDSYNFSSPTKMPSGIHTVGGGSTQWLGRVGQFIPSDFKEQAGHSESWPIKFEELDKYFKEVFGLITESDKLDREVIESNALLRRLEPRLPTKMQLRLFRFSNLNVYIEILTKLLANKNFLFLTKTTCLEILKNKDFGYTLNLKSSNSSSEITRMVAKNVVVCGGTMQSTALMMRSKNLDVPARENVMGRYLMEHFDGFVGSLVVKRSNSNLLNEFALDLNRKLDSHNFGISFSLTDIEIASRGLPNLHFEVTNFTKKFLFDRGNNFIKIPELVRATLFFSERLVRKAGDVIMKIYDRAQNQKRYSLWMKGEELPNPDSTLYLSENEKLFGIPKLIYNHKISSKTSILVRTELNLIQQIIYQSNLGQFRVYRQLLNTHKNIYLNPNWHPMGTMRMGRNKQEAICDSNLEVFNNPGLYLLNAAVFPSGSNQNPTAMVMALGQRLAAHLLKINSV